MTDKEHDDIVRLLPPFNRNGNLPPGIHFCSWTEFVERFGRTPYRRRLLEGLQRALQALKAAGCQTVFVGGSFVTRKLKPGDFDVAWSAYGVDVRLLDPVLLDLSKERAAQKAKYSGELFAAEAIELQSMMTFLEFFQFDKQTLEPKGIVMLDLVEI